MIPTRLAPVAFAFFVSIIMSAVISAVSTTTAIGFTSALPATWFQAWYSSWIVAFPILMVVAPTARRIVGRLTKPPV